MSNIHVACIGLATADTIVSLPGWPAPDGRMVADAIARSFGGPAATAAVTMARLGHRAAVVGAVGDDEIGASVRSALLAEGVDVTHLATLPGPSSESVILLDRAEDTRTILHAAGARLPALDSDALEVCRSARWIHVDQAGYALADAVQRGRISVDAGHRIDRLELEGLGLYAPSRSALMDRYPDLPLGAAVRAALDEGALQVAVTLGSDGAVAADGSGAWRVGGVRVDVASTLGAGDVFHGALLASLLDGLDLAEAVRRANVAAALSCRALDGRGAIPAPDELDSALADAPAVESVVLEGLS